MQEWIANNADFLQGLTALGAIASFIYLVAARARAGALAGVLDRILELVLRRDGTAKDVSKGIDNVVEPISAGKARASIGVMPFDNLSSDEEDVYLADGIAGDILSALTSTRQLNVAPRTDSFALRGQSLDISEIARRLSVRYVVTGSVRRAGNKLKVGAEFIDTNDGRQLWSRVYDRELTDVFEVQEDIAQSIAGAVGGETFRAEIINLAPNTDNVDAWSLTQQARHAYMIANNPQDIKEAADLVRRAIAVDPAYALAHATYSMLLMDLVSTGAVEDVEQSRADVRQAIDRALELSPNQPDVLINAGRVWVELGEREKSISALRRAEQISPYDLMNSGFLARSLAFGSLEDAGESLSILNRIIGLAPEHPCVWTWNLFRGIASMNRGLYEEAVKHLESALEISPNFVRIRLMLANALGSLGHFDEARGHIDQAAKVNGSFTPALFVEYVTAMARNPDVAERLTGGLNKAGIL
jgi:adenylate cyclase